MTEDDGKKDQGCGCGGGKWIWIGLVVAVFAVLFSKNPRQCGCVSSAPPEKAVPAAIGLATATSTTAQAVSAVKIKSEQPLPRLLDLGAGKCIPCKMMAPILDDLKKTYAGKMDVQFIDVWQDQEPGRKYGIRVIPTQIFFDATGKELFRHEGFFSKEDILAKWKELGVELMKNTE
ncbi:MAG: thioredoxin family protein [Verrucomicrobia bacterium]|nr:thioredoxin family protein [Verrucomicrobiota bacterium]MBU1735605.1 thioredoxin family protein [Verrucomicrobiota bacterium]MBU1855869.1 thioredoxin family protein [Verrucomicrobiota bacterium]